MNISGQECQISFQRAREIIKELPFKGTEFVELSRLSGRTAAHDITATIYSPGSATSLKDGYAVVSGDIDKASENNPVTLKITGTVLAGDRRSPVIKSGKALRIMTGAIIPEGANAVLASEFAKENEDGSAVRVYADAAPGKNILPRGGELYKGQLLVRKGEVITPEAVALLAASGLVGADVFRIPRVALLATGSEIVKQGSTLTHGQIFQSNQYVTMSWLRSRGIDSEIFIARDNFSDMARETERLVSEFDAIITSGGLLSGDRDIVVPVMESVGTRYLFRRVKMGPGKGVCLGMCGDTVIFNLPGGPPSNYLSFMLLALPGILRIAGFSQPFFPKRTAVLDSPVSGPRNWTQFSFGKTSWNEATLHVKSVDPGSRLMKIAISDCAIEIAEGVDSLDVGDMVVAHDFSLYGKGA